MADKLTDKQEKFCQAFVETSNASEAYRRAYDAKNMKAATISRNAFTLLENSKITARLQELRELHLKRHALTVDDLVAELEEARQTALGALTPQASAAVNATMGKAKLLGLVVDKSEHTGKDGAPIEVKTVDPVEAAKVYADMMR